MSEKECVLCGKVIIESQGVSLCKECISCADCCIGLEKL